jgi:hypothetical protein
MGLFTNLWGRKSSLGCPPNVSTDDVGKVDEFVTAFFKISAFTKLTERELQEAVVAERPADAEKILAGLKLEPVYTRKQATELAQVLAAILQRTTGSTPAKEVPTALGVLRPGDGVKGFSSGTIGGFLINNDREIFLFSDAHVLSSVLTRDVGKSTPGTTRLDPVWSTGIPIGEVVCSCSIRKGEASNLDIALARIDRRYYKHIELGYFGNVADRKEEKRFIVTGVDTNLYEGKVVYLFGNSSGVKVGKLKDVKPTTLESGERAVRPVQEPRG